MPNPTPPAPTLAPLAVALGVASLLAGPASSQEAGDAKAFVERSVEESRALYESTAREIFELAELGYLEEESSGLLQGRLRDAGFTVEAGVAGMPTAFVASWGDGGPVIGILAEFDALPGITQAVAPQRRPVPEKGAGHACGHHLFGTGSTAAAIAAKEWLEATGTEGTIRLYGTPAEEGGGGKLYMVREGVFDDADAVLTWHAGDRNDASPTTTLANKSAKFRFRGVSAHAAAGPERGRSALDAVEAMNHMVNLLREHVPDFTRIHYVITGGGSAPNVVPDFAEVYYYVRHPDVEVVMDVFDRVVKAAEGAATGTTTEMEYEVVNGVYSKLPNDTLGRLMQANLERVGGVEYGPEERAFAEALRSSLPTSAPPLESAAEVRPYEPYRTYASTDAGDVSWVAPLASLTTATWVPGTVAHSWQAIAAGGTEIGMEGMIVAAKTIAMTAVDLYRDPGSVEAARREFEERRGPDFRYISLVGDRPPPLDYRRAGAGR